MHFRIEINVDIGGGRREWRFMRPSHTAMPYEFSTFTKALETRNMCHPDQSWDEVRVVCLTGSGNKIIMQPDGSAILPDCGCAVRAENNSILYAPLFSKGGQDEWSEVSAPESQAFLDQVNAVYDTSFRMSQFSGR